MVEFDVTTFLLQCYGEFLNIPSRLIIHQFRGSSAFPFSPSISSEFGLSNGTTYNSFLIRGDKVALVDASGDKFHVLYLATLRKEIDPKDIDYVVANHTEPDHSGLIPNILAIAPNATVVGSRVCIQFLQNMVLRPFKSIVAQVGRLPVNRQDGQDMMTCPKTRCGETETG